MMVIYFLHGLLLLISAGLTVRIMIVIAKRKWSLNRRHALSAVFFTSLFAAVIIVTSYHGLLVFNVANSSSSDAETDTFYGIMFDAGSTGSRVHVFKFKISESGIVYSRIQGLSYCIPETVKICVIQD